MKAGTRKSAVVATVLVVAMFGGSAAQASCFGHGVSKPVVKTFSRVAK